ncbi:hypothetical protein EV175_005114 [Coemansia sp. RSA 1933]|nr:hypothetical protein EV175_005114 [Coemansia sp. RSA 1933]
MRKSGAKPVKRLPSSSLGAGKPKNDSSSSQFTSFSISSKPVAAGARKAISGFGDTEDDRQEPVQKVIQLDKELAMAEQEAETHRSTRLIPVPKKPDSVLRTARPNIDDLPDSTEVGEYDRVPVEDFGMMMLRGMGLAAAENTSTTDMKQDAPRPSLLGLGAKQNNLSGVSSSRSKRHA